MVVAVGLTLIEPLADEELKLPGAIETAVAPFVVQFNVLLAPELMVLGFGVKDAIVGADAVPGFWFMGLAALPPPQPARPAKPSNTKAMAKRSSPEHSRHREPKLPPQTALDEPMRVPPTRLTQV